jgi:hypothetical protein
MRHKECGFANSGITAPGENGISAVPPAQSSTATSLVNRLDSVRTRQNSIRTRLKLGKTRRDSVQTRFGLGRRLLIINVELGSCRVLGRRIVFAGKGIRKIRMTNVTSAKEVRCRRARGSDGTFGSPRRTLTVFVRAHTSSFSAGSSIVRDGHLNCSQSSFKILQMRSVSSSTTVGVSIILAILQMPSLDETPSGTGEGRLSYPSLRACLGRDCGLGHGMVRVAHVDETRSD